MPVLQTLGPLKSPPTNCYGLVQYLAQRLPGYDPSEYLRELNSAYVHVWEEITKLKNHYFTNIKTVTTLKVQTGYDLMFNSDGGLSAAISSRLYQVTRVRVQPPAGGLFQSTTFLPPNHPDFVAISANPAGTATQTGPYYCYLSGRNQLNWALPLAAGTNIEVTYTFWPIALAYLQNGTVVSNGTVVVGSNTSFTQLVQPDFASQVPLNYPPVTSFTLLDANSVAWTTTVTDGGVLQTVRGGGTVQTLILNDSSAVGAWQLVVSITGVLSTVSTSFQTTYPQVVTMASPSGFTWLLIVTIAGTLQTINRNGPPQIQEQIQAELVVNPSVAAGGQIYRVPAVVNDTVLNTATIVNPTLAAGSMYVLATLPEIPREHIRVIASVALAAMYSVAGDDARVAEWTAKSQANMQMMKDALMERQSNTPPMKQRFPYGIGRRNRAFLR
jgi:hypothetical protein